ncbi:MAG: hypothetical protein D6701_04835, partial [Gemmatimonadetes bacterium]
MVPVAALVALPVPHASAQVLPTPPPSDSVAADSVRAAAVSPGTAFLRSLLVPGWGQASVGSVGRGAFYFVTESASAWMIVKTLGTRAAARVP